MPASKPVANWLNCKSLSCLPKKGGFAERPPFSLPAPAMSDAALPDLPLSLIDYLSQFLTDRRLSLIEQVLESRSRYMTCLLEDIYQSQNASAIVRSCECCGLQEIHVVEDTNRLNYNPLVLRGADKWIDVVRHSGSEGSALDGALDALRSSGYRVVAATPHASDSDVTGFDLEAGPFALVMGNERRGISKRVMAEADAFVRIPMFGFTESFNVSVSAGILLSQLAVRLRASNVTWQLSADEKERLRLEWIKQSLRNPEGLIARYLETFRG